MRLDNIIYEINVLLVDVKLIRCYDALVWIHTRLRVNRLCIHLIHFLSRASAEVLQCELSDGLPVIPAAHVHDQEAVVLKSVDLMQREHGRRAVPHFALLSDQIAYDQSGLDIKTLTKQQRLAYSLGQSPKRTV